MSRMSLAEPRERPVKRTVALAGATGLVGRSIPEGLIAGKSVQSVHVLARRKPRVVHVRLTCHIVNFTAPVDEVYLASARQSKLPVARLHSGPSISTPTLRWLAPLLPRVRDAAA